MRWSTIKRRVLTQVAHMLYGGAEMVDGLTTFVSLGFYHQDYVCMRAAEALVQWPCDFAGEVPF